MFLLLLTSALAASPILASSAPGSCPALPQQITFTTNCTTLEYADDHRDWSYRIVSYDPLDYNVFTMFHYGSNPLECMQVDFRCLRNDDFQRRTSPFQQGSVWFRCTDEFGSQVEKDVPFQANDWFSGLEISITPSEVICSPKMAAYTLVHLFVIEGRNLLFTTCRNADFDPREAQYHLNGHLLLSDGPVEDDKRLLEVASRMFNQSFEPWISQELNRRTCNCTAYKQFLSDAFATDCENPIDKTTTKSTTP